MHPRFITPKIMAALTDTRVVLINGPRQSGKTTLARGLAGDGRLFLTLDDPTTLAAARADPVAFVRGLDHAVIDEVQRAPDVLLAIKRSVDEDRRPGRFLLTGSANLMLLPRVADSLAGRMATLDLLPLSPAASAADECGGPEGPDDCSSTRFTCGANSSGTNSSSNITGEGGKAESGQRNRARTLDAQVAVTYADLC